VYDTGKTTRKQKALATRRRILKAAHELFCERGYGATTMEAIAAAAGVAVQTLYFTFHTKAAILSETVGAAVLGFDRWDPRAEPAVTADPEKAFADFHHWFPAFERAKTQAQALAVFVDAALEIFSRVSPLVGVMAVSAVSDPDVGAVAKIGEQRRVEAYRFIVKQLGKKGGLRGGVGVKRATDVLLTVLSAETYHQLTAGRGWSPADCRQWLLELLAQQLLAGVSGAGRTQARRRAPANRRTRAR